MTAIFPLIGAIITLCLGIMGLLAPQSAAEFTSIKPKDRNGRAEIRATYGGLFISMGLCGLLWPDATVQRVLGLLWLGAAAGRLFSVVLDGNRAPKNLAGLALEAFLGLCFLAPMLVGF